MSDETAGMAEFAATRGHALMRTAYLLTGGDDHRAADLVQGALLAMLRVDFDKIRDPAAYAHRAVVNLFLNEQRRLPRARAILRLREPGLVESPEQTIVERAAIREALGRLSNRQRAAIVLRYYEDLGDEEIAGILGCGASTVRSTLTRARAKMREQLEIERVPTQGEQ